MNLIFERAYLKLIFEETLNNVDESSLPNPFKDLLYGLKNAMLKALHASDDQLKKINEEVNVWRDKLVQAWMKFSNTLTQIQQDYINNTMMDLVKKYTTYMHGYNTGY